MPCAEGAEEDAGTAVTTLGLDDASLLPLCRGQDRQVMHTQGPRRNKVKEDTRIPCSTPSPCTWQFKHTKLKTAYASYFIT